MAKLYLKFGENVLKEVAVAQGGVVTLGRLPDNLMHIDNLAVSGHHAKIYWEDDHFVIEDNQSLNGTYVNNQRVSKVMLKDGDVVLIGKHTVLFRDEWHEDEAEDTQKVQMPALPKMEATVVLDTKKAKEMLAQVKAQTGAPAPVHEPAAAGEEPARAPSLTAPPPPALKERIGMLTVLDGKTDQPQYMLSSKMSVIGKSDMASIKLKGSLFKSPPDVAAIISKRETGYYIAPQDKKAAVKINNAVIDHMHELNEGDVIEVFGVKMTFGWHE
jgi:pSer/pThr/pTyr-binding forkhead associated (FHA) protein